MSHTHELLVAVIMGSRSDWEVMQAAADILEEFDIAYECRVLSAHRTPKQLLEYIQSAEAQGCRVFVGAAGGAAHLAGVIAAHTLRPVLGVPMQSDLNGLDSLLSMAQMPAGIPVGTLAVGSAGAANAALLAAAILANEFPEIREKIAAHRQKRTEKILAETLPKRGPAGFRRTD